MEFTKKKAARVNHDKYVQSGETCLNQRKQSVNIFNYSKSF